MIRSKGELLHMALPYASTWSTIELMASLSRAPSAPTGGGFVNFSLGGGRFPPLVDSPTDSCAGVNWGRSHPCTPVKVAEAELATCTSPGLPMASGPLTSATPWPKLGSKAGPLVEVSDPTPCVPTLAPQTVVPLGSAPVNDETIICIYGIEGVSTCVFC